MRLMNYIKIIPGIAALVSVTFQAPADWIVLNGLTYRDVYIREGRSTYFVHFPDTGEVMNVPRSGMGAPDLGIDEDAAHRKTLLDRWRGNNPLREDSAGHREDVRQHVVRSRQDAAAAAVPAPSRGAGGGMAVRTFGFGEATLPKIILHNPSVMMASPAGSSLPPSRMGISAGPMQQPQGRGMGMMPSYGNPGVRGMGGFGGMGGGFGRDVTAITNISDLFFTIQDGLVGEAPATILSPYVFLKRN